MDDLIQRTIEPMEQALKDAGLEPKDIDEVLLVGGSTRIPKIQEDRQEVLRQGAEQGREPGRSRRDRRRGPGRGAHRRAEGRAAARRHAAVARHRDARRRHHRAHPAQHDDPDQEDGDVLDGRRQPDDGRDPRAAGRARAGARTTRRSASSSSPEFRPHRAACRRSRSRSTSTRTASCT